MSHIAVKLLSRESVRAITLCKYLLEQAEELPIEAEEFADGASNVVSGIMANIEANDRITQRQSEALSNIENAMHRWLENDEDRYYE